MLQQFLVAIDYVLGRVNVGADVLWRIAWPVASTENALGYNIVSQRKNITSSSAVECDPVELSWKRDQDRDTDLAFTKSWRNSKNSPWWSDIAHLSKYKKLFWNNGEPLPRTRYS